MALTPQEQAIFQQLSAKMGGQSPLPSSPLGQGGMQGFGAVNKAAIPDMDKAAIESAGNMSELGSLGLMKMGQPEAVPYGGKKSPWQAANEGLQQGLGVYNLIKSQQSRQATAKALAKYLNNGAGSQTPDAGQLYDKEGIPLTNSGGYGFGD